MVLILWVVAEAVKEMKKQKAMIDLAEVKRCHFAKEERWGFWQVSDPEPLRRQDAEVAGESRHRVSPWALNSQYPISASLKGSACLMGL